MQSHQGQNIVTGNSSFTQYNYLDYKFVPQPKDISAIKAGIQVN